MFVAILQPFRIHMVIHCSMLWTKIKEIKGINYEDQSHCSNIWKLRFQLCFYNTVRMEKVYNI